MGKIKSFVERILNSYGYYRSDMPKGSVVSEAEIMELFRTYGDNEIFVRLLRDICAMDIRLYFQAANDVERNTIRGAHRRTHYFISLIKKANDKRRN